MAKAVPDGYTAPGTVARRGDHPSINFVYRPALFDAVYEYQDAGPGKKRAAATLKLLLASLVSWDYGDGAAVTEAALKTLIAPQLDKMLNIVSGYALEESEADAKN